MVVAGDNAFAPWATSGLIEEQARRSPLLMLHFDVDVWMIWCLALFASSPLQIARSRLRAVDSGVYARHDAPGS